jgi:hypothetical protein
LALSQRVLALLLARNDAGTLFAPLTPLERRAVGDETAATTGTAAPQLRHDQEDSTDPAPADTRTWQRADLFLSVAAAAALWWPPLSDPAAEEARLRGVAAAIRVVLTLHKDDDGRRTRGLLLSVDVAAKVTVLIQRVLGEDAASGGLLHKLRAMNALTREEEATLRDEVLPPLVQQQRACEDTVKAVWQTHLQRATADVARHGLRLCALPGCGATELQPKAFKVCSRCRGAAYCSAAHQQQDWRRHKREDGCAAAPQ